MPAKPTKPKIVRGKKLYYIELDFSSGQRIRRIVILRPPHFGHGGANRPIPSGRDRNMYRAEAKTQKSHKKLTIEVEEGNQRTQIKLPGRPRQNR